jgi:2',3'-cyclic-nucleotide 2'-phosphodiesterase/3'-nucleotidase
MGGFWGSHLGVIDLMLEREGNQWRVVNTAVETRPIYERGEDRSVNALVESAPAVLGAVAADHAETLAYVRRAVGKTSAPLHSYFALVADDPSVQIVSNAQKWYITEMLKGSEYADLPVLSAAAPFKAGGRGGPEYYTDVPAGDVAIKNVADLYLYPNTVRAAKISGAELREWLERSAGMFNRITPGQPDQVLLNDNFPSYNFDVIDGVQYQIDLSQPAKYEDRSGEVVNPGASRIVNLTFGGQPVSDDMEFVIATNNYRAGGGGNFPGTGDTTIFEAPDTNRDVIVRYIVELGAINPSADGNWSFAPMDGTSVLFDTGPAARAYMGDVRGVTIEEAGDGPDGFARFRISL